MIDGSEQGWKEASFDSRRTMKQAEIRRTVQKAIDNKKRENERQEAAMEADYFEGAMDLVNAMMGNSTFGYSRRYAANYAKVFSSPEEEKK